ncbi:protein WHAT'S THIS FACTOR 1 homolog, chloroplastic-like [Phoenix dactylifera]|uniref:Protein WHAT'S THIS FACTOR 1 homolog, chloroplastic n=1 Tax=Phoenix dactylifera TaxID=42345 RepID=A0A8B9AGZ5_PHODC|nr:protein WHAT'S THIS FACTOR 1 homolog, chloroplastic [Phoenix dactylifera]XP_008811172.2 protein WHAT'S THIS FACTOR 1 homolog, chloroplastic [Phoenix dactylifera]XP_008811173.2 protein WHAT'S THIS FACTOR 1 homolog, chloroplastic [Phoenix dactylifera]XP_038983255.1 protein WHAT'S THIS FACTOR 1 homolog, chloroplastic-like [Phoenix dactylifera]XP_038983256.1 protein WHAT'S THIS FACTOR 1 homolog, chloroplastic-like [Phoenix dactylifera]XP_038983257.1 protein WHAT'S THIS FACTOR 1 homolog, chlorop
MAWRRFATANLSSLLSPKPNPNRNLPSGAASAAPSAPSAADVLPFLNCRQRKKLRKKLQSPRVRPIQHDAGRLVPHFETILHGEAHLRFITRTKSFLAGLPGRGLPLADAGKLHRELGFPRGRKVSRFAARHPLLLHLPRLPPDSKPYLAFTPLMDSLLEEERALMDAMEPQRVTTVRKLLMISARRRIPLAKLHHCRLLFGLPDDFRDRVRKYPDFFRIAVDPDGRHVLELVEWDPALAVSTLERDFVPDEARVLRTFKFTIPHGKSLPLEEDDERTLNSLTTLPLVSPYSDGSELKPWSLEAEKYRVGVIHEFLSLTLEKRAWIHHLVEFKEEFSLTKHTYQMLLKQPRAFYLAGTAMNWAVFLKDAYKDDGSLIEKDPQVVFNEKLHRYACMTESEGGEAIVEKRING